MQKEDSERGRLYLIPSSMGEGAPLALPAYALEQIRHIKHFVVEQGKTARSFIKGLDMEYRLQEMTWSELNKRTVPEAISSYLEPIYHGEDLGLLSEAGCPGVADPGAELLRLAHEADIEVRPLVGPSSLLLALMSSGLNGQCFAFQGYLPIQSTERKQAIRGYESRSAQEQQTQLFIETPYRNQALWDDLLKNLRGNTRLCLALDLTLPQQYIRCRTVQEWKKNPAPNMHKRLAVFLFLAGT